MEPPIHIFSNAKLAAGSSGFSNSLRERSSVSCNHVQCWKAFDEANVEDAGRWDYEFSTAVDLIALRMYVCRGCTQ